MDVPSYIELGGIPKDVFEATMHLVEEDGPQIDEEAKSVRATIGERWRDGLSYSACAVPWHSPSDRVSEEDIVSRGTHSSATHQALNDEWIRYMMLISLHAKACVIAGEVRLLLTSGYSEGARSRLRTMHECLICSAIVGADESGQLAVRFHDAALLEHWSLARVIDTHGAELGWETVDPDGLRLVTQDGERVIAQWGDKLKQTYEWARPATRISPNSSVTFRDLEKSTRYEARRAVYKLVNHGVHVSSTSILDHLRTEPEHALPFGSHIDPDQIPFLAGTGLRILSDVTLEITGSLVENLHVEEQLQQARVLEFLASMAYTYFLPDENESADGSELPTQ